MSDPKKVTDFNLFTSPREAFVSDTPLTPERKAALIAEFERKHGQERSAYAQNGDSDAIAMLDYGLQIWLQAHSDSEMSKEAFLWRTYGNGGDMAKDAESLRALLRKSRNEMANLLDKIRNKEAEGWEGSKRRCILFSAIDSALKDTQA